MCIVMNNPRFSPLTTNRPQTMDGNTTILREFRSAALLAPRKAIPTAPVVTNLSVHIDPSSTPFSDCDRDCDLDRTNWYRIEKDLCLHEGGRKAWLYVELRDPGELTAEDLVVTDIQAGVTRPFACPTGLWTDRGGGLSVRRERFPAEIDRVVTAVDILFGEDAVDPRPRWVLLQSPLQLGAHANKPSARLTLLRGRVEPDPGFVTDLRVSENGEFKIVQISDMHLTTGVGSCEDAMERDGTRMGKIRADQETLGFVRKILMDEEPDFVILSGDQLHHDIDDSQTAIFKAAALMITYRVPWAFIFGNHDDEGLHALSRKSLLSPDLQTKKNKV